MARQKHQLRSLTPEAAALLRAYAFGKVVASRADMLTFIADPLPHTEASMLHFKAAVHARMVGVQVRGAVAECLGIGFET